MRNNDTKRLESYMFYKIVDYCCDPFELDGEYIRIYEDKYDLEN